MPEATPRGPVKSTNMKAHSRAVFCAEPVERQGPSGIISEIRFCRSIAMDRTYAWLTAAAFSVAMVLGSSPLHAAAAPAAIDACALLSADQVSAVVGKSVEITQPFDNGITPQGAHSTTCIWAVPL